MELAAQWGVQHAPEDQIAVLCAAAEWLAGIDDSDRAAENIWAFLHGLGAASRNALVILLCGLLAGSSGRAGL